VYYIFSSIHDHLSSFFIAKYEVITQTQTPDMTPTLTHRLQ